MRSAADHAFTVRADAYVLATGGIENPRLLLASTQRHPAGIGNAHDLVGRYFMEHPHYASGCLVPADRDVFGDETHWAIHPRDGVLVQKKYTLPEDVVRREGLLGCTFRFEARPRTVSDHTLRYSERAMERIGAATELVRAATRRRPPPQVGRTVVTAVVGVPSVARYGFHRTRVRIGRATGRRPYLEPQVYWIRAMAEQAPNPTSRVHLLDERDHLGVPRVALDWRLTDQDRDSTVRSQQLLAEALGRSGHRVESLVEDRQLPPALSGGMHHMGTTRMHASPRQGVVDPDCRVHGTDNLYVSGSSVFPTVGYANPTLTILALALRLADHLRTVVRR